MNYSITYYRYYVLNVLNIFKKHFMFSERYCSHVQDLQDFIRRTFGISRPPSFPKTSKNESQHSEIHKDNIFKSVPIAIVKSNLLYSNPWIRVPEPSGSKIQKSWNVECSVSPISKSKSYKIKSKQNNSPELLSLSFP